MKLLTIEQHNGCGVFPLFEKGTAVDSIKPDAEYPIHAEAIWGEGCAEHWVSCAIEGHDTFIPKTFITDGVLNRNYNPTEPIVEKGQIITLLELVFEWLYVKDENGKVGWLAANKAVSIK
jgi:hypothetical protein